MTQKPITVVDLMRDVLARSHVRNVQQEPKERSSLLEDKTAKKYTSLLDAAKDLDDPQSGLVRVAGRTLPKGYQYNGADLPGHGKAAQRRLKQLRKLCKYCAADVSISEDGKTHWIDGEGEVPCIAFARLQSGINAHG